MAEPLADIPETVRKYAGARAEPAKTTAQLLLERFVQARTRLAASTEQLRTTMVTIRGKPPAGSPAAATAPEMPSAPETQTEFFPALEALVGDVEALTAEIEAEIQDLARRF